MLKKMCVKSFLELPTLKQLPLIGHTYLFLPGGRFKSEKLTEAVDEISKDLGPIFRLKLGGSNIVITTNPDHTITLFRNEGIRPIRPPFPALYHYRKNNFNSVGVVPGNGEEWYKFRNGVNPLLKSSLIQFYIKQQEDVSKNFIEYLRNVLDDNFILYDTVEHLLKFSIEVISIVCPGYKINCLSKNNPQADEIKVASKDFMDGLYKTLIGPPIWKYIETSGYKQLKSSHQIIYRTLQKFLKDIKFVYDKNPIFIQETQPFMYSLLSNKNLSEDDCNMLVIELFLGGIDTISTTLALTFFYLAQNKEIQNKARLSLINDDNKYLKACLKETLRLSPTAGANSRFLIKDTLIGDYLIPKNTLVSAFSSVSSNSENYFKNADEYLPDRWLRESDSKYHKFASLPFGYGPRMCPGKRLAENEMVSLLKEVLNNFLLESANEEKKIGMVYRMNRIPEKPINIKFIKIQ